MLPHILCIFFVSVKVFCHDDTESLLFSHEDLVSVEEHSEPKRIDKTGNMKNQRHLGYQVTESSIDIKRRSYCQTFRTCFECTKSAWYPCDWCHNFGCTSTGEKMCPYTKTLNNSDIILKMCPFIQHEGPILLPSGIRSHITVTLRASEPILYDTNVICQIKLKNRLTHLKGVFLKDSVHCYPVRLDPEEYMQTVYGSFRVIWGGVEPHSNELPITVYNCESLADECESCGLIDPQFGCGWCDSLSSCVTVNKCDDVMNWSLNRVTCKYVKKKLYFV